MSFLKVKIWRLGKSTMIAIRNYFNEKVYGHINQFISLTYCRR